MRKKLISQGKLPGFHFFMATFFVLLTVVLTSGPYMVSHASDLSLDYASGKLSANVSNVPLVKVLEALSAKSGIKVLLDESLKSKTVSAEFENLPIEKGIKRLVQPHSSAMIFGKRTTPAGRVEFYVSELKVFDNTKGGVSYMLVGKKMQDRKDRVPIPLEEDQRVIRPERAVHVPPQTRDPAKAAAFHKKASSLVLRTRVAQKLSELHQRRRKMQREEDQKKNQLRQLRQKLNGAAENEVREIQANISSLRLDLRNLQIRNAQELKRLQREVDQLKHRIVHQSGS